ncbi:DnaD domain protein [Secundilactobacillus malefermentans]|uniref:DnaD domain protein n=1 Tax=Secundilactobacillus malefermentans TaxID=176292 RepID=UPI0011C7510C|nr:DnaD domain protein [Secundilactobacillus malefermentans]QEA32118.1 DnaD domain protein [Secundilactobacillus malefermentans]
MANKLLIDEAPLQVLPSLAKLVGLNEAIVLQQVHYWTKRSGHEKEGNIWTYQSYTDWSNQFPFWSKSTIIRVIKSLEQQGLLITNNFNKARYDKTKWYRINLEKLASIASTQNDHTLYSNCIHGCSQNDQTNTLDCTKNYSLKKSSSSTPKKIISDEQNKPKEIEDNRKKVFKFWESNGFGTVSPIIFENIDAEVEDFTKAGAKEADVYHLIVFALTQAVEAGNRRWRYVYSIFNKYLSQRIFTLEQAKNAKAEWQRHSKRSYNNKRSSPPRETPEERLKNAGKESINLPF